MKLAKKSDPKHRSAKVQKNFKLSRESIGNLKSISDKIQLGDAETIEFCLAKVWELQNFDEPTIDRIKRIEKNVEEILVSTF